MESKISQKKIGNQKISLWRNKKHKAWIRLQAIKKYGNKCELCGYELVVATHHILPKKKGGLHEIDNLMVLCPNCHAVITRGYLYLKNRKEIPGLHRKLTKLLKPSYPYLG